MTAFRKGRYSVVVPPPAAARLSRMRPPPGPRVLHSPPVDLRHWRYPPVPPLGGRSASSEEDYESRREEEPILFPDLDPPHPRPYVVTAEIDLRPSPRSSTSAQLPRAEEDIFADEVFPYDVLEELLDGVVDRTVLEEVAIEARTEVDLDRRRSPVPRREYTPEMTAMMGCPVHGPRFW